jgi:glycosyltransferase involved in cell wall biosynthesis
LKQIPGFGRVMARPMKIVQITPGAGGMYCGNCFRDNALVSALRKLGHDAVMVPLYLPLTLDEQDQSAGVPIFFGGINVYLDQRLPFYDRAPAWLRSLLSSPVALKWAAGRAAKTRAADLGDLTLSMLRGEEGRQAVELNELVAWLKEHVKPDVICLSNALLVGMVRGLKSGLGVPVFCVLQGEDTFLDSLPEPHREQCWQTASARAIEVDGFISPSRYFGDLMSRRLSLRPGQVSVVYNGIALDGYDQPQAQTVAPAKPPVLGFFARMCPEKGLDTLVDAFIELRKRNRVTGLKLRIGGSCGPADEPYVAMLRGRLQAAGLLDQAEFHPNVERSAKIGFLRGLSVFSVPARYGEAFGLYLIEALADGVPVVQPKSGAFTELIEATGGGVVCEPGDPGALADAVESLLVNPEIATMRGVAGRRAVFERFTARTMAEATVEVFERAVRHEFSLATGAAK